MHSNESVVFIACSNIFMPFSVCAFCVHCLKSACSTTLTNVCSSPGLPNGLCSYAPFFSIRSSCCTVAACSYNTIKQHCKFEKSRINDCTLKRFRSLFCVAPVVAAYPESSIRCEHGFCATNERPCTWLSVACTCICPCTPQKRRKQTKIYYYSSAQDAPITDRKKML